MPQQGRKVFTLQTLPACEPFDEVGKVAGLSLHAGVAARAHDGVGLCGISHILKGFTAKAMRDFSVCHPLRVSEPQRGLELRLEDPVFSDKYSSRKRSSWSIVPVI